MQTENEFSRVFEAEDLPDSGRLIHIEARPAEREALARRFGILRVDALMADAILEREGRAVRLKGRLVADVVQACVVTLEPVANHVADDFSVRFERGAAAAIDDQTHLVDPDEEDIEVLTSSKIDVGEIVAEQLALALPTYPRKDGAEFQTFTTDPDNEISALEPPKVFSGLYKLLRKQ